MSQDHKPSEFRISIGGIPCYVNPNVDKPGIIPGPCGKNGGSAFVFKDQAQLDRFKELLNVESAKANEREAQKLIEASNAATELAAVLQRLFALRARKSYRPQAVDDWLHSSNVDRVETLCQSDMAFIAELGTELEVRQLERDEARLWAVVHGVHQILTCAYCGHAYPKGTAASGVKVLTDHLTVCEKHPMRQLEAKVVELLAQQPLEFTQGFGAAIASLIRDHDRPTMAVDIATSSGLQFKDFEESGLEDFDLGPIRTAWGAERPQDFALSIEVNTCEHGGDHPAPEGARFCSKKCADCDGADFDDTQTGCAGICGIDPKENRVDAVEHRDVKPDNMPEGG